MKNGCILCAKPGVGKSRTGLAFYFKLQGGDLDTGKLPEGKIPKNLFIITTAKKRDDHDWEKEMEPFGLTATVDSWNNIAKYININGSYFIFDEQRVVGNGVWVKSFLKIAKNNEWILLSATPGDTWSDYIPVFIANGFYRNRTEFYDRHVVFRRFTKYPQVDHYLSTGQLLRHRNDILVKMRKIRQPNAHHEDIWCGYDTMLYRRIVRDRWNPWEGKPIKNAAEFCYLLRRAVNTDITRISEYLELCEEHPKVIVFYNFDYELDILKSLNYEPGTVVREWNGHRHEPLPFSHDRWVYLVQYTAGAEGWNCIETDTMIFYSQNYSYKVMEQSAGRIDRFNTLFDDLFYYHLKSHSGIDVAIGKALEAKKKFNETGFYERSR